MKQKKNQRQTLKDWLKPTIAPQGKGRELRSGGVVLNLGKEGRKMLFNAFILFSTTQFSNYIFVLIGNK